METKPTLNVIQGDLGKAIQIHHTLVTPAINERPPFDTEIEIEPQDTWRVLSTYPFIYYPTEHPVKLLTDLINQEALTPGQLLAKGRRWEAIIYDLDQQPICKTEWVEQALEKALTKAGKKEIKSMKLPLLGSEQGVIPWRESLELICRTLLKAEQGPRQIWLVVEPEQLDEAWKLLKKMGPGVRSSRAC